jgi:hypothetical protein
MNRVLGEFFARGGSQIVGVAAEVMGPDKFQKIETAEHMELAYELGRQAFTQHPDADASISVVAPGCRSRSARRSSVSSAGRRSPTRAP